MSEMNTAIQSLMNDIAQAANKANLNTWTPTANGGASYTYPHGHKLVVFQSKMRKGEYGYGIIFSETVKEPELLRG